MGYSPAEKIQTQVTEGAEDIDFLGILEKEHVKRLRMFMKNLWNFHWCWFLTLAFPPGRGFTQFYRICRGGSLFSKSKLTNLNNSGFFQKSSYRGWNKGKTFAGESIY